MLISDILDVKDNDSRGPRLHRLPPESTMAEAIHRMAQYQIGSIVVSRDDDLLGLLTIREIMAVLDAHGAAALAKPVGEVMNPKPITGRPTDSIDRVRRVMTENHVTHLPVLDGGRLLDIISLQDVAKAVYAACSFENRLLKHYIAHWPGTAESTL